MDSSFMDVFLTDFSDYIQHGLGVDTRRSIHCSAQALLATFESFPRATLRLVFRHIGAAPASPGLASAAHALVDLLRKVHTESGHQEEWPGRSTLPGAAAAASSPRRQHGASSPRRGRRDNGRQGRSSETHSSSSRNTRPGQKKTRRDNSSNSSAPCTKKKGQKSRPGISSSSNPPRK